MLGEILVIWVNESFGPLGCVHILYPPCDTSDTASFTSLGARGLILPCSGTLHTGVAGEKNAKIVFLVIIGIYNLVVAATIFIDVHEPKSVGMRLYDSRSVNHILVQWYMYAVLCPGVQVLCSAGMPV